MPVECVGQARDRNARILDHDLRHVDVDFALDDQRRRTARDRSLGEAVPVDSLASDGNEEAPGLGRARIDGESRDLYRQRSDDARRAQCVEQRP